MKTTLILIGLGGAIGSMLRYLTTYFVQQRLTFMSAVLGTLIVNIVGSLLIGIVYGLSERQEWFTPQLRFFLATGLCGGYTTFSAFSYENVDLLQQGNYFLSFAYIFLSIGICLIATFLGVALTKAL
jgi:CrcB protein